MEKGTGITALGAVVILGVVGLGVLALILIFAPGDNTATVALIITTVGAIIASILGLVRLSRPNGNGSGGKPGSGSGPGAGGSVQ